MTRRLLYSLLLAFVLFAATLVAQSVTCPIDDSGAYFTGKTQTVSGRLLYQYKCNRDGHLFWVRR